ncbi:sialic acid TRAP transporter small permease protein SiaQ [Oceanobacillus oncorhynchi subsp. incaldanensis]|uniref:TRAP transporter small permease n=1 Tax=Oceanobacillus oncorhynchi TaxID=545501 RepID=UPI001B26FB85|nr:TRAP transporter small permease [Oceanobacillus oncorhynchi]GIO20353.1 sialic acid TRAP transporter small permease protein SiaQ [Oceanobacillus oncorhynchi subsp. incaldanensis]
MQKAVNGFMFLLNTCNRIVEVFLAIALSVMSLAIFYQVFSRYVMGSATSWSEELARTLMIYIVLLGSALALKRGEMLSVDLISEMLKKKSNKILQIIVNSLSIIFYIILVIFGFEMAERVGGQSMQGLGISMYWFYFSIPLGGVFLTLNSLGNIIELIRGGR